MVKIINKKEALDLISSGAVVYDVMSPLEYDEDHIKWVVQGTI